MTLLHFNIQVQLPITKSKSQTTLRKVVTKLWEENSMSTQWDKMPEGYEKYLKASDFLKALIESRRHKEITMAQFQSITLKFLIELQIYLDFDEIFLLAFKYKIIDLLFEFAESTELTDAVRERFAVDFFRYTITHDRLALTVFVCDHYEVQLFRQSETCIEAII